jgi:hypothetical protein
MGERVTGRKQAPKGYIAMASFNAPVCQEQEHVGRRVMGFSWHCDVTVGLLQPRGSALALYHHFTHV